MNQIRGEFGLNITPISVHGLRQAIRCLESGGAVVIAADVPIEQGESLTFMGRPCRLPLGHARLAMKTGAQMIFGASRRRADGLYEAVGAPIPKPESAGDRREEERQWAQAAASRMENYIRKRPTEWFMPHRLWPEQSRGASADGRLRYSLNAV
jgi:KDO2-lipid IV(A) lauroyltransferase